MFSCFECKKTKSTLDSWKNKFGYIWNDLTNIDRSSSRAWAATFSRTCLVESFRFLSAVWSRPSLPSVLVIQKHTIGWPTRELLQDLDMNESIHTCRSAPLLRSTSNTPSDRVPRSHLECIASRLHSLWNRREWPQWEACHCGCSCWWVRAARWRRENRFRWSTAHEQNTLHWNASLSSFQHL